MCSAAQKVVLDRQLIEVRPGSDELKTLSFYSVIIDTTFLFSNIFDHLLRQILLEIGNTGQPGELAF
jgi:hypothetical protein